MVPESFRKLRWGKVGYPPLDRASARYSITIYWRTDGDRPAVQAFLRTCREVAGSLGAR